MRAAPELDDVGQWQEAQDLDDGEGVQLRVGIGAMEDRGLDMLEIIDDQNGDVFFLDSQIDSPVKKNTAECSFTLNKLNNRWARKKERAYVCLLGRPTA